MNIHTLNHKHLLDSLACQRVLLPHHKFWWPNAAQHSVQQLSCLSRQLLFFIQLEKRQNYMQKGCWSLIMAFPQGDDIKIVRNFRMQAVRATFFNLPRFNICWY